MKSLDKLNRLFFITLLLYSMQLGCMESSPSKSTSELKQITGSPEEIKVLTMDRDVNKDHKKLLAFTLVMREELKPASFLIKQLVNITSKDINNITTLRHNSGINSVSFSPNGNYVLSGANDKTIKLWDIRNKQNPNTNAVATLTGHTDAVASVSWSPDGNYALSGDIDGEFFLWDLRNKTKPYIN